MSDLTRETMATPEVRRPLIPVEVPTLGGTLFLRRLSAAQVIALSEIADEKRFTGEILVLSTCFADGALVWPSGNADDALAYPMEDLKPLIKGATDLNGLSATAVKDRQGNSEGDQGDGSSS